MRVTFDDMEEALTAVEIVIDVAHRMGMGMWDREKTAAHGEAVVVELKNGSCISFHFADKVWMADHWVRLVEDKAKMPPGEEVPVPLWPTPAASAR